MQDGYTPPPAACHALPNFSARSRREGHPPTPHLFVMDVKYGILNAVGEQNSLERFRLN
jgi:hypothetical protein